MTIALMADCAKIRNHPDNPRKVLRLDRIREQDVAS